MNSSGWVRPPRHCASRRTSPTWERPATRPVTFHYRAEYDDGQHLLQYGLIAEEVVEVDRGLVEYDGDGKPLTVSTPIERGGTRYTFDNFRLRQGGA